MKYIISLITLLLFSLFTTASALHLPDDSAAVTVFYGRMQQKVVWLSPGRKPVLQQLRFFLKQAPFLGLEENDYQSQFIYSMAEDTLRTLPDTDAVAADRRITAEAIRFFCDVAYGPVNSAAVRYNGLAGLPDKRPEMARLLADCLLTDSFSFFLQHIEPEAAAYAAVKKTLTYFYTALSDSGFAETPVVSLKADTANIALIKRLGQLGFGDSIEAGRLQESIIKAQEKFNVLSDGVLRSGFLRALNVPFVSRIRELKVALNHIRWLYSYRPYTSVVVNIPSTGLQLFQDNKPVLYSRVITGKKSTPTPTLASRITEVVLYPYWMVPHRIATRELLPRIKLDRSYLEDNQFEILDKKGRIVNAADINWQSLSAGNFPYVIRQNTGCDNSLGIVKLNFYSPFTVYLHDTPGKNLFMLKQRFFSHGCIRVEEAASLARLLLDEANAQTMDSLIKSGPQADQKPVVLPVKIPALVFVLYNTTWPDNMGEVRFYEDVYNRY
ncbi:L,D-transpeptidase family protein [Chitinophaga ginsengisegetis]|uniref:L,D-transpeptidase family protein n=1 Tax=Chitinophaga ginsengisegetis TaxID=393003 RepID=UPI00341598DD